MAPSESFQWPAGLQGCFPRAASRPRSKEWFAKIVVSVHGASFLIGRGGKKVQQLQEDSGARMQLRQGAEAPAGMHADNRLIEVHGGAEELEDGLFVVLTELDRIPEALAPRVARLLVPPGRLAAECLAEAGEFGAQGRLLDIIIGGEQVLELAGTVELRVQASTAVTSLLARRLWKPGGNRCIPAMTEAFVAAGVSNGAQEVAAGLKQEATVQGEGTSNISDAGNDPCTELEQSKEGVFDGAQEVAACLKQEKSTSNISDVAGAPWAELERSKEDSELNLLLPVEQDGPPPLSAIAWHCGISADIVGSDVITGHLRVRFRGQPAANAFATLLLQIAQRW